MVLMFFSIANWLTSRPMWSQGRVGSGVTEVAEGLTAVVLGFPKQGKSCIYAMMPLHDGRRLGVGTVGPG